MADQPHNEKSDQTKESNSFEGKMKIFSESFSILGKVSIGIGIALACCYLLRIQFLPKGLSSGDVLLFALVALTFAFLTVVGSVYGIYCMVWFNRAVGCAANLVGRRWGMPVRHMVPKMLQDKYSLWISVGVFAIFFWQGVLANSSEDLHQLLFAAAMAGMVFLALMSRADACEDGSMVDEKFSPTQIRAIAFATLFALLWLFGGFGVLLDIAFVKIGIRHIDTDVELTNKDSMVLARISQNLGVPVISCRAAAEGNLYVHHADVLWSQVGSQALVEFRRKGQEPKSNAVTERYLAESDSMRIVGATRRMADCYPYKDEQLFMPNDAKLSPHGETLLTNLIARWRQAKPKEVLVVIPISPLTGIAAPQAGSKRQVESRADVIANWLSQSPDMKGVTVAVHADKNADHLYVPLNEDGFQIRTDYRE